MKLSFVSTLLLVAGLSATAQEGLPRMLSVDPLSGKAGDVIAVTGENLDKTNVDKVYLTDGKNDVQVEVTEQTGTTIKFKIPAKAATGERLAIMILTAGKDAKYIEEPVRVMIEP
jgi:nitrous oxidase accessory protein NosD